MQAEGTIAHRRPRRRAPAMAVVAIVIATVVSVAGGGPAGAQAGTVSSACPSMTDSINRLYRAFFLRDPEPDGFAYWRDTYSSTSDGLAEMSANFVRSTEFQQRYGALDNAGFVHLVYMNVLGRHPDTGGFNHWVRALDNGFPRGSLMISFSESQEFVAKTGTTAPAAGYLQWFQGDVRFECSAGHLRVTVNGQHVVNHGLAPHRDASIAYTSMTDATGILEVDVPTSWTDRYVQGAPDGTLQLLASPDIGGFADGWVVPGVQYLASHNHGQDLSTVLAEMVTATTRAQCHAGPVQPYEDGLFTGVQQRWMHCGGTGAEVLTYAVRHPRDPNRVYEVLIQIVDHSSHAAATRILESFNSSIS